MSAILSIKIDAKQPPKKPQVTKIKIKQDGDKIGDDSNSEELYVINHLVAALKNDEEVGDFVASLLDCDTYYVGIGIRMNILNEIEFVAPGGPADMAGLKKGDVLAIYDQRIRDMHPIGTLINVPIIRDGITIDVQIKVDKICTKD